LTRPQASATATAPGNASAQSTFYSAGRVAVYFSPNGGAQAAIVREIDGARQWIRLQAYSFTSAPIAEALVRAHRRGVRVRALLDKSNATARYSGATFLQNAGIEVLIDASHAIAHSKVLTIDGTTLVTGSFNFSKAAEEKNAENLLIIKDAPGLLNQYAANWKAHSAHAKPYERK
jgi:phosphatidylserine/phosphatidylglycerophosphate/cardiolipin synthase-like enzyme